MRKLLRLFSLAAFLVLAGCGSDSKNPTEPDPVGAQNEVNSANEALEAGDYESANTHFKAAIAKDPTNVQAQIGAGVTEVYLLQNDPEVSDIVNSVPQNFPVRTRPSFLPEATAKRLRTIGFASGPSYDPVFDVRATVNLMARAATDPPALSEIQRVIRTKVMPKIQYVEDRLNVVEARGNFVLKIPPAQTHEPDTLEIDLGDVYVLDATINNIQGCLGVLVAYNFDLPSYEHVNAESLLAEGTDFGTLHPVVGALSLSNAQANFLRVKTQFDLAVASINAETDPQDDDLIPKSAIESPEFANLQEAIDKLTEALTGPVMVPDAKTYNNEPFEMQIDISRFFSPPIDDLKTEFPHHAFDDNGEPYPTNPLTFDDPTLNGIFPDMTNERWQLLVGPVGPPPVMARK